MKGIYSGNEDWLTRQRWIPIVLVAVAVIGGWAVGSRHQQGVADKHSEAQHVQPTAVKPQAPKQAAPEPMAAGAPAPPLAEGAKVETVSAVLSQPTPAAAASTATRTDNRGESSGDAAKRMKQHKACLELAKDTPSTPCK
jgi:hypothetical protein